VWLKQSSKSVVDEFQTPHHGLIAVKGALGFLNNFRAGFHKITKGFRLQPSFSIK
jgi:hypothetical protein